MRGLILIGLLLLAGCGAPRADRPPEIRYGKDLCAECRMILGDKRVAAALADEAGEIQKFDDIGCVTMYQSKIGTAPKNFWVHDYATEEWMEGKDAFFAQADNVITPMGYGVAAFSSRAGAQQFVEQQQGRIIPWEGMLSVLQKKGGITREINT